MADKKRVMCNLALLMAQRNIRTIAKLSEMTGLARLTLEKCYNGTAKMLNYDTTVKLCVALDCELDELYIMVTEEEYQERKRRNEERKKNLQKGYVYFIKSLDTGLIKIGRSGEVEKRLNQISKELEEQLVLIRKIPQENSVKAEKELHQLYAEYRKFGEWFNLPETEIRKIKELDLAN